MKIIGLELRMRNPMTGVTKELSLIPLDLEIPDGAYFDMPCTIHTEYGDIPMNLGNAGQQQIARSANPF